MIDWLMAPIDAARPHMIDGLVAWHARVMVMAWGVLVPLGIMSARFFKILPRQKWPDELDNRTWWYVHQSLQYLSCCLSSVALGLIWAQIGGISLQSTHAILGWTVMSLAVVQLLGGWLRGSKGGPTEPAIDGSPRGDHYDMTRRRRMFERVHKTVGYLALLVAFATILSGLWHVNAPVLFWALIVFWWTGCFIAFVALQARGFAVDTYQAIWGANLQHPGNRIEPLGWGINRRQPSDRRIR